MTRELVMMSEPAMYKAGMYDPNSSATKPETEENKSNLTLYSSPSRYG